MLKSVCVFCGSSPGRRPEYMETAKALGEAIAARNLSLVYGGAHVGLMGQVADAVLAGGGEVVGVIPQLLMDKELAHTKLTKLVVVQSMHERKLQMAEHADAFVALPGGFGTFEEFCEIVTWSQLALHAKPCILLNLLGYYDRFLAMLDHAVEEQFLAPENRVRVLCATTPQEALDIAAAKAPADDQLDRDRT